MRIRRATVAALLAVLATVGATASNCPGDPGGCGAYSARDGDGRDRNSCEPDGDDNGVGDDDQFGQQPGERDD